MNLLKETIESIEDFELNISDIVFIGSEGTGHCCSWEQFQYLANQEYDDGYGAPEVATDLIIVFADGTKMWRHEYDGSESWDKTSPFKMPTELKPIAKLFANGVGWETLEEIHSKQ